MSTGQDFAELISAVRHLQVHARQNLAVRKISGIAVLGPLAVAEAQKLTLEIGLTVIARDDRQFDEAECSRLMAVCATQGRARLHGSASLAPSPAHAAGDIPPEAGDHHGRGHRGDGPFFQSTLWGWRGTIAP